MGPINSVSIHCAPHANSYGMKWNFADEMRINRTPVPIILWGNMSVQMKPRFIKKKVECWSTSPSWTNWKKKNKSILLPRSRGCKTWTTVALHGRSSSSFIALAADDFQMPSLVYYPATLTLNAGSMRTKLKYRGGGRNRPMWWTGNDRCCAHHV
jgi:hypothetical protein